MTTRMDPVEAAHIFVDCHFPEAVAAFVGGSVIQGGGTSTSDLDIVVVTDRPEAPYRESFRALGWPIETFVHTPTSMWHYVEQDARNLRPSLLMMCAEGMLLRDRDGAGLRIKEEARALLAAGPAPLTPEATALRRYSLTNLLDDFIGTERPAEGIFIADELAVGAASLLLLLNRHWIGSGKWVYRALARFDPDIADRLVAGLRAYYRSDEKAELIAVIEEVLDQSGGTLFEGYRASGTRLE